MGTAGRRWMRGLLAGSMWLIGCGPEKIESPPLTPVAVATVDSYSGNEGSRYSASITPYAQVSAAFKASGYITKIFQVRGADGRVRGLDSGDRVTRGVVLAQVREDDYLHSVQSTTGNLSQANAAARQARLDFDRATALFNAQALTQPAYDSAKTQLDSSNAAVISAEATLKESQLNLSDCSLVAPIDGWIASRNIEVGDLASPGTVAFTIVDTQQVKAVFGIPDTLLNTIHLGDIQKVSTEALAEEFQGHITAVSPQADPKSRVFQVDVTIPNPRNRLRPGMVATLHLGGSPLTHPVPVVPLSAIVSPGDGSRGFALFVVTRQGESEIAKRRRVQLGESYGNRVAIVQGVLPGERVVATGATQVTDGQAIQVVP
jgi:RND family efflux transporter MFP subunit